MLFEAGVIFIDGTEVRKKHLDFTQWDYRQAQSLHSNEAGAAKQGDGDCETHIGQQM